MPKRRRLKQDQLAVEEFAAASDSDGPRVRTRRMTAAAVPCHPQLLHNGNVQKCRILGNPTCCREVTKRASNSSRKDSVETCSESSEDKIPMARRPQPQFRFGVGVGVPVVVVDHHNDALRPFFHALSRKMLPLAGVRMLHFDSHPDLQVMALGGSALHAQIAANQYNPPDVLKHSRIYSWIMPMVLAGALSEVWWFSGAFCGQIDVG
eukprot:EG_transcript_30553